VNGETVAGGAVRPQTAPALRETTRPLDTRSLPDGSYLLKVVASDRPSNPSDPLTAQVVSEPFIVCNSAPMLYLLGASVEIKPDRSLTLTGTAMQKVIAITAVQWRVDSGDWASAAPADGIFDSSVEHFSVATQPLAPGSHSVEVKAFNAAGLTATDRLTIEVK
jgi:hypothetical protein